MPKVSIIVPVYKVEKYLDRCIQSILNQIEKDWELLLIDDGSPDNSGIICERYASVDSRIIVYHKTNSGVSSARNLGLDYAKGEWICFIDSDDYISEDFLMVDNDEQADVIQKSYAIVNANNKGRLMKIKEARVISNKEKLYNFYVNKRNNALWDKLIRRSVIQNKRFNEKVTIGEDFLFFLSLLPSITVYKFSRVGIYYYVIRGESAMANVHDKPLKRLSIIWANIEHIKRLLREEHQQNLCRSIIYTTYIPIIFSYRQYLNAQEKAILKDYLKNLNKSDLLYTSTMNAIKLYFKKFFAYLFLQ